MDSYPDFIYNPKSQIVTIEKTKNFIVSSSEVSQNGQLLPEYFSSVNEVKNYLHYHNIRGTVGTQI